MTQSTQCLPQWTWDDLETALGEFDQTRQLTTLRTHLLEGLRSEVDSTNGPDLLKQVLSAGWVIAQMGASATDPRPDAGRSVSH